MVKHGEPPFLECSSRGDKRFSAFYARIKSRDNKSIEEIYQAAKIFADGTTGLDWKSAKGRRAVNQADVSKLYDKLWGEYLEENPIYLSILMQTTGVSDMFGQYGHCCQATSLWKIRQGLSF